MQTQRIFIGEIALARRLFEAAHGGCESADAPGRTPVAKAAYLWRYLASARWRRFRVRNTRLQAAGIKAMNRAVPNSG